MARARLVTGADGRADPVPPPAPQADGRADSVSAPAPRVDLVGGLAGLDPATVAVHAGLHPDERTGALAPALVASSTYRHGNAAGLVYGRTANPMWWSLEEGLAALERASGAVLLASGSAAIEAIVEQVPVGAAVVAPVHGYQGTRQQLQNLDAGGRLRCRLVDTTDTAAVAVAAEGAALVLLETINNTLLGVPDLRACVAAAHRAGAMVAVDNTFATPLAARPLELGADAVVHSLSKYVGGHSDLVLGAAACRDPELLERLRTTRAGAGAVPGALETWLALRGLRTLDVRVRRQFASAAELARRLSGHAALTQVIHPALPSHPQHGRAMAAFAPDLCCGVFALVVRAGDAAAERVCDATRLWLHATSLGGVESTMERRTRYELDAEVCPPGLIRCSVGVEHVDDLHADLEAALRAAG